MNRKKLKRVIACFAAVIMLMSTGIFSWAEGGSLSGNSLSGNTTPAEAETEAETESSLEDGIATLSGNDVPEGDAYALIDGVNIIKTGATDETFDIDEGQVVMISGQEAPEDQPIVFENCTFNLSGGTVKISGAQDGISYNNGETVTKLWIGGNVQFDNCTFVTAEGSTETSSAGYDAAIYFFSGNIQLNDCELSAEGYNGQFLGLYGSNGSVTFNHSSISTVGNKNGWSYAMYGGSVLKLVNGSSMTATGMSTDSGNINAFYSGDNRTGYDAIYVEDSTIDFSDNQAGGFAINNVNIHVDNSEIYVNNNLGNACNSGYWIVNNSTIQMNGNREGHALSCIGFEMTDSTLEILHNGYAGIYIQSRDSSLKDCTVDIRCNGETLLSYSAGDIWLNGHTLTIDSCTSTASEGSAWLGGVGRTGAVQTLDDSTVVAFDLDDLGRDKTSGLIKSNTSAVLNKEDIVNGSSQYLFINSNIISKINPEEISPYARGNTEGQSDGRNDADLWADADVNKTEIIAANSDYIAQFTDAQLSHHKYDWTNGEITDQATEEAYGVTRYACTDVCASYTDNATEHPYSFDCNGTYVYAPLVGLHFEDNVNDEEITVANIPTDQTAIPYATGGTAPQTVPTRDDSYIFTGWYKDAACTEPYDFSTETLTDNWTVVYAGWAAIHVTYEWVGDVKPSDVQKPADDHPAYGSAYNARPQTPSEGYVFDGWYTDKGCTIPYVDGTEITEAVLDANNNYTMTLYGRWTVEAPETTEPETTQPETTAPEGGSDEGGSDSHENWIIARKVWSDETAEHPTIWFRLYRQTSDGQPEAVPNAELKKLENGRLEVAWDGLDLATPEGKPYTFFVKEVDENGNDYTPANYVKQESGLTVINTYVGSTAATSTSTSGTSASGQSPKTGDSAPVALYVALLCVAGAAAAGIVIKKRRDKIN